MNPTDLMELSSLVRLSKGHDVNHQSLLLSSTKFNKALVQGVGVCADNGSDRWDTKPVGDLSQGGRDRICHVDASDHSIYLRCQNAPCDPLAFGGRIMDQITHQLEGI